MKRILGIIAVLCLIAVPVMAKDYEVVKKAGVYDVTIRLDKSSPVVGDNIMRIAIRDASGATSGWVGDEIVQRLDGPA